MKFYLNQDVDFFRNNQLIDYSLLVYKVVYLKGNLHYDPHVLESCKEKDVYYHIAIIDYLQEWNIDKFLEQKAK